MNLKNILKNLFSVCVVLATYFAISVFSSSPSIPDLNEVIYSVFEISSHGEFYSNLFSTLKIVFVGISASIAFGIPIAVITSISPIAKQFVMPIINTVKSIPSIAMFPVFIILMGIGDKSRIFVIFWNSLYAVVSSTVYGMSSVERTVIEAAKLDRANDFELYLNIRLPLAFINILEGLKIAISNGFVAIVVAEMLGATKGLGYMIVWSSNAFRYPEMYAYVLTISAIGYVTSAILDSIIKFAERKIYD